LDALPGLILCLGWQPSLTLTPGPVGGATARAAGLIEIVLADGTTVRVDAQIDPRALRRVLAALRG
jgi:hypothetical protein